MGRGAGEGRGHYRRNAMTTVATNAVILAIARERIHPDPKQPRSNPDAELRTSIEANGILQPLVVRPHPERKGEWLLVDGERRWRGAEGVLDELPARVDDRELSRAD